MTGMVLECGGEKMEFSSNWCWLGTKVTWFAGRGGGGGHGRVKLVQTGSTVSWTSLKKEVKGTSLHIITWVDSLSWLLNIQRR